jgi:hypothetical protein
MRQQWNMLLEKDLFIGCAVREKWHFRNVNSTRAAKYMFFPDKYPAVNAPNLKALCSSYCLF